jgi:hypothetical protein
VDGVATTTTTATTPGSADRLALTTHSAGARTSDGTSLARGPVAMEDIMKSMKSSVK